MEFYSICTKKTFESKKGTQTKWLNFGTLKVMDDGKQFIELAMFPDTSFYVFEQKKKDEPSTQHSTPGDWDA